MIKSISIEKLFTDVPFHDRFARVAEAGFTHVEFGNWPQYDLDQVGRLLDTHALQLASISGDRDFNLICASDRPGYLAYLEESAEAAVSLGCQNLVIHSNCLGDDGSVNTRGNGGSVYARTASATRILLEAAALAERYGVVLHLEPVSTVVKPGYAMHTTESAGGVIAVVDSPHVRLLYDVYHMQMMEGNIVETLRRYADIIGYVQVADVPERFEPGTGEINFDRFTSVLLGELSYEGVVGFELYPSATIEECLAAIRRF
ncbi:MAG: TIM barrel protein [Propioniciclava sp.]